MTRRPETSKVLRIVLNSDSGVLRIVHIEGAEVLRIVQMEWLSG